MKKIIISMVTGAVAIGAVAFQLNRNQEHQQAEVRQELAKRDVRVSAVRLSHKEVSEAFLANGVVEASQTVELLSETDGRVIRAGLQTGDAVAPGKLLLQVDGELKEVAHRLDELTYQKAQRDFSRLEALYQQHNVSEFDLENARLQMQTAESQLKISARQLAQTRIYAPIRGVVLEKMISTGSTLQPGMPVARLADIGQVTIRIYLTEAEVIRVKPGDRVTVRAEVYPDREFTATVRAIIPQTAAARAFPVEISLENSTAQPLLPGMSVRVTLNEGKTRRILALPRRAISGDFSRPAVLVIRDQTAHRQSVRLGQEYASDIEVLEGVAAGDLVVVSGQQNTGEGEKVSYSLHN
jgi:membrane fusion protein, multidrug efflux system